MDVPGGYSKRGMMETAPQEPPELLGACTPCLSGKHYTMYFCHIGGGERRGEESRVQMSSENGDEVFVAKRSIQMTWQGSPCCLLSELCFPFVSPIQELETGLSGCDCSQNPWEGSNS